MTAISGNMVTVIDPTTEESAMIEVFNQAIRAFRTLSSLEARISKLEHDLDEANSDRNNLREERRRLVTENHDLALERDSFRRRSEDQAGAIAHWQDQHSIALAKRNEAEVSLDHALGELKAVQEDHDFAQRKLKEHGESIDFLTLERDEALANAQALREESARLHLRIATRDEIIGQLRARLNEVNALVAAFDATNTQPEPTQSPAEPTTTSPSYVVGF